jgi:hypothetical protein
VLALAAQARYNPSVSRCIEVSRSPQSGLTTEGPIDPDVEGSARDPGVLLGDSGLVLDAERCASAPTVR